MKSLRSPIALILTSPLVSSQIPLPYDAPKPLSPEQSAAAFKLPEGFRMEVIASEPGDSNGRYYAGRNTTAWQARETSAKAPLQWDTVTLDLWADMGSFSLTGIAPTAMGGDAWFDRMALLRQR